MPRWGERREGWLTQGGALGYPVPPLWGEDVARTIGFDDELDWLGVKSFTLGFHGELDSPSR